MNAMTFAAPVLFLGLVLAAAPASADQKFGRPADRQPVNVQRCSLSRSCAPGPAITIIIDKSQTKVRRSKTPPTLSGRGRK